MININEIDVIFGLIGIIISIVFIIFMYWAINQDKKKKPLTKQKKAEYDLYSSIFCIIILAVGLIFMTSLIIFAFHNIDLAYNYKDNPLDHYDLFTNKSQTPNELYSSGWSQIFGIIIAYNAFSLCLMGFLILYLIRDYDKYKRRFKRTIR